MQDSPLKCVLRWAHFRGKDLSNRRISIRSCCRVHLTCIKPFYNMPMKRKFLFVLALVMSGLPSFASSLGTATRTVIPSEVQQILNVDYRRMKNSDTAMAMKAKLLPPNMKQFEDALKDIGVTPDKDLEQITIASFRMNNKEKSLEMIGIAQGQFPRKKISARLFKQKIKGKKVNGS